MRFSQRLGITHVRSAIQGRDLDGDTRNRLWNAFARSVRRVGIPGYFSSWARGFYENIWAEFFKKTLEEMPNTENDIREYLRAGFLSEQWYEVYDLLEFALNSPAHIFLHRDELTLSVATVLSEEKAGFRLMDGKFVEITNETELMGIEESLDATSVDQFLPAREHLTTALGFLSDRREPDYRNSIKESISAVEAIAQIITGNPKATLTQALSVVAREHPIHGALHSGLSSLYGYTSDDSGIRHALSGASTVDYADAKFMLVACSAFVLYLIQITPSKLTT